MQAPLGLPVALALSPLPAAAAGEEWRGRPALSATVRLFSPGFFRKVITRHDTGEWAFALLPVGR